MGKEERSIWCSLGSASRLPSATWGRAEASERVGLEVANSGAHDGRLFMTRQQRMTAVTAHKPPYRIESHGCHQIELLSGTKKPCALRPESVAASITSLSLAELGAATAWTCCKNGETTPEISRRESLSDGWRCFRQTVMAAWKHPTSWKVGGKMQYRQAAALIEAHAPNEGTAKETSAAVVDWWAGGMKSLGEKCAGQALS